MFDDDMTWWQYQDQELEQLEEQERIRDCDIALALWRYESE